MTRRRSLQRATSVQTISKRFLFTDTVRQECSKGSLAEVLTIPEQLLGDYSQQRSTSSLFQILQVARNIREAVDRVVLLGDGITHGIRLL